MRVFVGDVQGCREPLDRLLRAVRHDPVRDRLFFCGDLVNKGPDDAGVLRRAIELGAESVLGNHDVALLDTAAGRRPLRKGDTFQAVLDAPDRDDLLAWLAARPVLVRTGEIVVVHAGIHPRWDDLDAVASRLGRSVAAALEAGRSPFDDPDVRFALTARYCAPDGRIADPDWPPPPPPYRPWMEYHRGPDTVVFGHWARGGLQIGERYRGLDTGCVYGGTLTAWIAEEDRVVAVPRDP